MYGLKEFLQARHLDVFPNTKMPDVVAVDEYEVDRLLRKKEEDILPTDFAGDAFRWLTVEGFLYYLPIFIRCTFVNLEDSLCTIEQNWSDLAESGEYRKVFQIDEKWKSLFHQQRSYVLKWNLWILSMRRDYLQEGYVQQACKKLNDLYS